MPENPSFIHISQTGIDLGPDPNVAANRLLLINLCKKLAENSPRKRSMVLMHNNGSEYQEMINGICKGSYIQPHKHDVNEKNELEGLEIFSHYGGERAIVVIFDDKGGIESASILGLEFGGSYGAFIPSGKYHTIYVPEGTSVLLEMKAVNPKVYGSNGEYDHSLDKQMAPWAPSEADPASSAYLDELESRVASFLRS